MIKLIDAVPDDAETIRRVAEETWWPTYSNIIPDEQIRYMLDTIYSLPLIRQIILDGTQKFILATDSTHQVQGFAAWAPRPEDGGIFKLHKLYVKPGNQGLGYGKKLIGEVTRRLLADDRHMLELNVNRNNPALHFYQKMGFIILRTEDISIGQYWMNDYVMRLSF